VGRILVSSSVFKAVNMHGLDGMMVEFKK